MQEQLVSFETAKLAKEKGFDEICLDTYSHAGVLQCRYNIILNNVDDPDSLKEEFEVTNSKIEEIWESYKSHLKSSKPFIAAPTQSLLQKWLRETHNIHIVVWWRGQEDKFYFEIGIKKEDGVKVQTGTLNTLFKTYEEALEKGLFNALNFINYKKSTNG